jgi:hypothetical protein
VSSRDHGEQIHPVTSFFLPATGVSFFLPVTSAKAARATVGGSGRYNSAMGGQEVSVASTSWLTLLFLFPDNFSFLMLFLLSYTLSPQICLGVANGGVTSDLAFEQRGAASSVRPSSSFLVESPLSPPPLPLCCMNQFVDELICDVLNPSV